MIDFKVLSSIPSNEVINNHIFQDEASFSQVEKNTIEYNILSLWVIIGLPTLYNPTSHWPSKLKFKNRHKDIWESSLHYRILHPPNQLNQKVQI